MTKSKFQIKSNPPKFKPFWYLNFELDLLFGL